MSPQKKNKLESAIDHLFASPHAPVAKSSTQEKEPARPAEPEVVEVSEPVLPVSAIVVEAPSQAVVEIIETIAEAPVAAQAQVVEMVLPAESRVPTRVPAAVEQLEPVIQVVDVVAAAAPEVAVAVIPVQTAAPSAILPTVMQPAPAADDEAGQAGMQMVIFVLDGQFYGIGIEAVESIIKVQPITKLPHVPPYIIGLTNLRGKVLPVFSLVKRFNLPERAEMNTNRIIVVHAEREMAGLMVDGVSEVETVPFENIGKPPAVAAGEEANYISGIAKLDDRLVILLDLKKVISLHY